MQKQFQKLVTILFERKGQILLFGAIAVIAGLIINSFIQPSVLPQQAIPSLADVALPQSGQKVLIFSPHPDDETIAAAGYIALSLKNGADVRIVLVTDGNMHNNEIIRYAEFRRATALLGVRQNNLVFLGLPDGKLHDLEPAALKQSLKEQIDSYNPDILLYPHPKDKHTDHSTTGKAIAEILKAGSNKITAYEYLVHYKLFYPRPVDFNPSLYLLPPTNLMSYDKEWRRIILPQDIEDLKVSASFVYRSQFKNLELRELILSSIRKNELLAIPAEQ